MKAGPENRIKPRPAARAGIETEKPTELRKKNTRDRTGPYKRVARDAAGDFISPPCQRSTFRMVFGLGVMIFDVRRPVYDREPGRLRMCFRFPVMLGRRDGGVREGAQADRGGRNDR